MKIIVAGGLGYVGSALVEHYRTRPELSITVVDRAFVPERVARFPEHVKYIQGDIQDLDLMRSLLEDADVLHMLAAEVEAEKSKDKSERVWQQNFEAPRRLFEVTPSRTRIMFPSSGNVFGGVDESEKFMGLTEEDEPAPKLPYAETKREMELWLKDSGKDHVILRFGTNHGYAPGVRFNLVTNIFFHRAMTGQQITVHGEGTNYRPTVCVKDCARALDHLSIHDDASGEIFHVVRESFQIRELAQRMLELCESEIPLNFVEKVVPFSAYALNSDKIKKTGFEFAWDLESSITDMREVFKALRAAPTLART